MKRYGFGIDVGGTAIKMGLFTTDGELIEKWEIKTNKEDQGSRIFDDIAEQIDEKLSERNISKTEVCGCGKKGCLEQYASANGIVRMTKKALATETRDTILNTIENLTAKDIFDAAKSNDTVAAEQVEKMGNILGTALASIACVINPERIVIGGGVSKAGKILIDVIEKHFMEQTFHACRNAEFALAELGNDAGIYGGACLILQNA